MTILDEELLPQLHEDSLLSEHALAEDWNRPVEDAAWLIAAMFAAAAWAWSRVPDQIPVHWNAAGQVDGYGSRFMGRLLIPLITLGMHLLFMVLHAIDPCRTSYDGFARVYAIFRGAILAFMGAVYAATTLVALGHRVEVARVITVALGLLFVVLGSFLGEVRPNWFVGVRTPWR